jgi:small subunit ribosomal protein S8
MKNHLLNMFVNIQNGQMAKKSILMQPKKNICESFLQILWNEGYISGYRILNNKKIEIFLKYTRTGKPVINSIKFLSKPSRNLYYSIKQIWKLNSSKTFIVFSTNKGLKTINDCKKIKIGGKAFALIN